MQRRHARCGGVESRARRESYRDKVSAERLAFLPDGPYDAKIIDRFPALSGAAGEIGATV